MQFLILLLFATISIYGNSLSKEDIRKVILSASEHNTFKKNTYVSNKNISISKDFSSSPDLYLKHMSIKDFAQLVSSNDHVNIMISNEVDAKTNIYMYARHSRLLPAFSLALSLHGFKLQKKNGFYYVIKDTKKELRSFHIYQLRSDIYSQVKPMFSNLEHTYLPANNRLVIQCSGEEFRLLSSVLSRLDSSRRAYNIKVTVFDLDSSLLKSRGIDTSVVSQFSSGSVSYFIDLLRVTQTKALPYLSDTTKLSFYSFIDFLDSKSAAKIELTTIINTLDGVPSHIDNVTRIPILKSSVEVKETNTKNTNQFDYQNIGSTLTINPHFMDSKTAYFDLKFSYSTLIDSLQSDNQISQYLPTYTEKSINNIIRLKRGQAVLVGGFKRINRSAVENSVPFLSDLPAFGHFFSYKKVKKSYVTTYILIEYMNDSISHKKIKKRIQKFTENQLLDLF
jgi:type II secretory pathway component GspD/PulD (secretin)